jgi:twitching motility two-component system response regulator PilG
MTERIVVADDSLSMREAAQSALERRGSRVVTAADGNEALARLRDAGPALLIADVHMPGLDGYALCREAKSERPDLSVLLMVGTFEPFDSAGATAARADGVMRKPFTAEELLRKVEEMLGPAAAREPARPAAPAVVPAPASPAPEPEASHDSPPARAGLSAEDVDRVARRLLEIGGAAILERVARELLGEAAAEAVRRSALDSRRIDGEPEDD